MHLDAGQRRGLAALAILTAVSVGTAWEHGWEEVVGILVIDAVVAAFFLSVTFYANRYERRARRVESGQQ